MGHGQPPLPKLPGMLHTQRPDLPGARGLAMGLGWPGNWEGRRAYGCWPSASPGAGWASSPPRTLRASQVHGAPRGCAGPHCPRQTPWVPTQEEKQEGQGRPASCYSIQKGRSWVRGQGRDAPGGRSTPSVNGLEMRYRLCSSRQQDLKFLVGNHLAAGQMLGEFLDSGQRGIGMGYTGRPAELPQPPVGLRAAP